MITHLFQRYGVEIEYIIVDKTTLNVLPIADKLLAKAALQNNAADVYFTNTAWSNELVKHVLEIKSHGVCEDLTLLPKLFQQDIKKINELLSEYNAELLPTAMHPWMNPLHETCLWSGDNDEIYTKFHSIFNCYRHGWANLQSVHLNLPFANDEEFARLHTAIRLLLPLIPALSASSPLVEGRVTGIIDNRLDVYWHNQQKIPSIAGKIIPEIVTTRQQYEEKILRKIYQDIAAYDCEGLLCHEWLNSRGAIARFERNTVEIRLVDTQECPLADCAILYLLVAVIKELVAERWCGFTTQLNWHEDRLAKILASVINNGQSTMIADAEYLNLFGINQEKCNAGEIWQKIVTDLVQRKKINFSPFLSAIEIILQQGNLSERILSNLQHSGFSSENYHKVYGQLAKCLQSGVMYKT